MSYQNPNSSNLGGFLSNLSLPKDDYLHLSRTAIYSFLIALPLLVLYEVLIFFVNFNTASELHLGVEVLFKKMMLNLGTVPIFGMTLTILAIGIFIFIRNRKKNIPIRGKYFGWMITESAIYAVLMGFFVSILVGSIFGIWTLEIAQADIGGRMGFLEMLTLSIGAGLYEEFFFRLILVGGLFWFIKQFYQQPQYYKAYIIAAVVGALIFSGVHYIGNMGDEFMLASFTFRFLLGLILNVIFLVRGFGIAAWSHSLYDIMVTMMM